MKTIRWGIAKRQDYSDKCEDEWELINILYRSYEDATDTLQAVFPDDYVLYKIVKLEIIATDVTQ